jgi:signal transduction histidine kinase/CheY-like chemotaxis protein/ligand-binding sensor domain-containing protein
MGGGLAEGLRDSRWLPQDTPERGCNDALRPDGERPARMRLRRRNGSGRMENAIARGVGLRRGIMTGLAALAVAGCAALVPVVAAEVATSQVAKPQVATSQVAPAQPGRASEASRPGMPPSPPRFVRFGPAQGLSLTLNDLAIDLQGYVWVATGDGLARYDGERFRFWRRELGRAATLPDNEITVLHVDAADRVWAATWERLSVLDPPLRVPRDVPFEGDAAPCGLDITAMQSDARGALWLSTQSGDICRIAADGRSARMQLPKDAFDGGGVITLYVRSPGDLLVGAENGLWRVRVAPGGAQVVRLHADRIGRVPVSILSPAEDGAVWIGADGGPQLLGPDDRLKPLPWTSPAGARRAVVLRADDGTHWIGGYVGLYRRPPATTGTREADTGYGIDDGVFRIARDREGGLWFASYSQGLYHLPPQHDRFGAIVLIGGGRDGLPGDADPGAAFVGADWDAQGDIWLIASTGLHRIRAGATAATREATPEALGMAAARAIRACADGRLAIADDEGVLLSDPRRRQWRRVLRVPPDHQTHAPETLHCDRSGQVWVSLLGGGIVVLDPQGRRLRTLTPEDTLDGEVGAYIDLRVDPAGRPWYSDGHALRRWDGERFVRVPLPAGEYVYAPAFADARTVWVARFGAIERYAWDGRALHLQQRLSGDDGVPAAEVRSLAVAADGSVWLNSVRGLIQYDPRQRRARLIGTREGLPETDLSVDLLATSATGELLALADHSLIRFDPLRPLPPPRPSTLAIEALELRRGEDTVAFAGDRVVMRPGDRDLRVAARVMSFADPSAHRFRFRLRGHDPDWVREGDQGERGERMFSSLPPGRYVLEIQGANADGVWTPTRWIEILVEAPWWRRGWALLLYAVLASALVWWLAYLDRVRMRRNHNYQLIKQKRELAEQASLAKSRFLANLGHEVRTPMTGVLGMSELLLATPLEPQQRARVQALRRAGEHLLGLVNDALDLARIEAGRFEPSQVEFELGPLLDDVASLMQPLAERKGLRFALRIDAAVRGGWRGDPVRIRQILLNLLGNAIKFTERGEVALTVEALLPQGIRCTVVDTGPGLDDEQQRRLFRRFEQAEGARTASRYGGSGLGLAICQELAMAMGGGIELISAPGEGACFVVRLPLPRAEIAVAAPSTPTAHGQRIARDLLLVEDDPTVADVLVGLLQAQGHRVVHAAHALAALSLQPSANVDLALIDLDLPGMDGLALVRLLRAQGFTAPAIAITARADAEAEPQAMAAGFDAFLRKPLIGDMLAEAIAAHTTMPA